MKNVLFVDAKAGSAYDFTHLEQKGLGGTEATALRVCQKLSETFSVTYAQCARATARCLRGVRFVSIDLKESTIPFSSPDSIVVLDSHKILPILARNFPFAKIFLWLHCFPGKRKRRQLRDMVELSQAKIVCVSDSLREDLQSQDPKISPFLTRIYNPVVTGTASPKAGFQKGKMICLSSPHKGLNEVLKVFQKARRRWPFLKLYLADPGYLHWKIDGNHRNVVKLGSLSHTEAMEHLQDSMCLFYPQTSFRETFGLVLAEANALGVPALVHDSPTAREVLSKPFTQIVDARKPQHVLQRLAEWIKGKRPQLQSRKCFNLDIVVAQWQRLLLEGRTIGSVDEARIHA